MIPSLRIKVVGENQEGLQSLLDKLSALQLSYMMHSSVEEACESLELEPADLIIISGAMLNQSAISQLQKREVAPQIISYISDKKIPNFVKVLAPFLIDSNNTLDEVRYIIDSAITSLRKGRRLLALRTHQKRGWNFEYNPALHLITSLVKKCTLSEDFPDLLNAMLTFRNVIEFQDSTLILFDHKNKIIQSLHAPNEKSENIVFLKEFGAFPTEQFEFEEPKAVSFNSSQESNHPLSRFTRHPWGSGLAIGFRAPEAPMREGFASSAILVLYRRDLLPFSDRDLWLLEMTYGPLALALEKVVMLKAIEQASKEWRSTFDGISEPLTVVDHDFQIVKANKSFAKLIGHDIKKIKNKRCYTLLANRRSPCPGCPALMDQVPSSGVRLPPQGKEKKDLLAWSYAIRTGLGAYHFQFYRDVSKETILSGALIQSEKMAALGRLVGAIAHEINNPIAGILATTQILLGEENENIAQWKEDLVEIKNAAWRSKKIIDDLLGFTGGAEKSFEKTNIAEIIHAALTFSRSALQGVKVSSNIQECMIQTSASSLQQILFNLITNAAQAMNNKGHLNIHSELSETHLHLVIEDDGPGIPSERLKHIFDPFYTSKQEGSGTGLGLSIVKNLAAKIGTKISVDSSLGKGTKFHLDIPLEGQLSG